MDINSCYNDEWHILRLKIFLKKKEQSLEWYLSLLVKSGIFCVFLMWHGSNHEENAQFQTFSDIHTCEIVRVKPEEDLLRPLILPMSRGRIMVSPITNGSLAIPKPVQWQLFHPSLGVLGFCVQLHEVLLWSWVLSPIFNHSILDLIASYPYPKERGEVRVWPKIALNVASGLTPRVSMTAWLGLCLSLSWSCSYLFSCPGLSPGSLLPCGWPLSVTLTSHTFSFIVSMYH